MIKGSEIDEVQPVLVKLKVNGRKKKKKKRGPASRRRGNLGEV